MKTISIGAYREDPKFPIVRRVLTLRSFDSELSIAFLQVLSVRARAKNIFFKTNYLCI
ncbi:hypothetical protein [Polaromonas sp.]|uniref:hypothetical protein n=1 Tax=Polaromonas sp. TaxID=1869339 RepID=UPI0025E97C64|nr:hypothetical protein [Polaromonas sp.]